MNLYIVRTRWEIKRSLRLLSQQGLRTVVEVCEEHQAHRALQIIVGELPPLLPGLLVNHAIWLPPAIPMENPIALAENPARWITFIEDLYVNWFYNHVFYTFFCREKNRF